MHVRRPVLALIVVAVLVRLAAAWSANGVGLEVVDERHYATLAGNLTDGVGFAWGPGEPTSIRPPLYPAFVAAIWGAVGEKNLQAVRWVQVVVSLFSVWLVYLIGCQWFDRRSALLAAAGMAIYPSLLFAGVLILTETVFVVLLLLFIWCCGRLEERPSLSMAFAAGLALGLSALARSVMWPFILLVPAMAWFGLRSGRSARVQVIVALVVGYAAVVGPWAVRNTLLQGTSTVVDTMGGLNLLMGNYEHTPEDRMWDAVSLTGDQYWSATLPKLAPDGRRWTEGTKEKWAQRQAVAYMLEHPGTTLRRSLLKFADFWGLERDFIAGFQRGYYQAPTWFVAVGAAFITLAYIATAILAVVGIFMSPPDRRAHVFLLTVILFICGVHTIVFGHSRYHLPLIPILLLYAAAAVTSGEWRRLFSFRGPAVLAAATLLVLALVWSRDVLVRDWDRIRELVTG